LWGQPGVRARASAPVRPRAQLEELVAVRWRWRLSVDTVVRVMAVYRTTFRIDASSEVVSAVLADFERYSEGNPVVAVDRRRPTSRQHRVAHPRYARWPSPKVKARLTEVVPQRRLRWHGNVGADCLFAVAREFVIEEADHNGVNLTHVEDVHGASSRRSACSWAARSSVTMMGSHRLEATS